MARRTKPTDVAQVVPHPQPHARPAGGSRRTSGPPGRTTVLGTLLHHARQPRHVVATILLNYVLCSGLFMLTERSTEASPGPISSLWWGIVTGSTVGYGDYSPVTTPGRGVAAWFIVSTILLMLLLGAHFTAYCLPDPHVFTDLEQRSVLRRMRSLLRMAAMSIEEQRAATRIATENNIMLRHIIATTYDEDPDAVIAGNRELPRP